MFKDDCQRECRVFTQSCFQKSVVIRTQTLEGADIFSGGERKAGSRAGVLRVHAPAETGHDSSDLDLSVTLSARAPACSTCNSGCKSSAQHLVFCIASGKLTIVG